MIFVCNVAGLHVRLFRHLEGNRVSIAIHSMVLCYCICLGTVFEDASLSRNRTRPQHTTKTTHAHCTQTKAHKTHSGVVPRAGDPISRNKRTVWCSFQAPSEDRVALDREGSAATAPTRGGGPEKDRIAQRGRPDAAWGEDGERML